MPNRLSENAVFAIRREFAQGKVASDLAHRYGVTERTIKRIVSGKTWRNVPNGTKPLEEALITYLLDEKSISGALRSSIHAHGEVSIHTAPSAAKRIRGALKARAALWRKQREKQNGS